MKKEFCNCTREMEEKVLEHYKENSNLINPNKAEFDNYSFLISGGSGLGVQPFLPVTISSETKNGKPKKTKVNIYFTYCPLCGQKWRDDAAKQEGE